MAIAFASKASTPVVKPGAKPVKLTAKQWRERDPEAYRAYMREYMKKRRAG
jgi:hypothetical protein